MWILDCLDAEMNAVVDPRSFLVEHKSTGKSLV